MDRVTIFFTATEELPRLIGEAGPDQVHLAHGSTMRLSRAYAEGMAEKYPRNISILDNSPREEAPVSSSPPRPGFVEQIVTKPVDVVAKGAADTEPLEPLPLSIEDDVEDPESDESDEDLAWDGVCHGTTKSGLRCRVKVPAGVFFCRMHEERG